ncbi:hypothetical protein N9L68_00400 [bacterium]|nr:hypothetical protein [bacterium]
MTNIETLLGLVAESFVLLHRHHKSRQRQRGQMDQQRQGQEARRERQEKREGRPREARRRQSEARRPMQRAQAGKGKTAQRPRDLDGNASTALAFAHAAWARLEKNR